MTIGAPGPVTEMAPPQVHMHFDWMVAAGVPATVTIGDGGAHGAAMTGRHGIGVSTPEAAAVADATAGFVGVVHMPKGGMFTIGF